MTDPRTPVVVGVAQTTRRPEDQTDVAEALEPVDLMVQVIRAAERDSGARRSLVERIDATYVAQPLSRRYPDPGLLVNRRIGREEARSFRARVGGNSPQLLVNEAAAAIARGRLDVAVVVGAEAMHSRFRAKREGVSLAWEHSDAPPCPHEIGDPREGTSDVEERHGATIPIRIYPLFETALRAAANEDVRAHQQRVGRLWSGFSTVAARNPLAWTRDAYGPEEIIEPGPGNRTITFPYTKRMCANMRVDQAAAVIMTSVEAARAAGVPDDRLVFPLAGADAHDHFFITERWSLSESPALRLVGRAALDAAQLDIDDVAHLDLYSCFPSAVQIAASELGVGSDDDRPLTLTGGLAFFGGPGNNYVTHSIAEVVGSCRADPGSHGMVTGVGWYLTKHSAGIYSTEPRPKGFARVDPATTQREVDALPRRAPAGSLEGVLSIEASAVVHDRGGRPVQTIVAGLTDDGARALAVSDDPDVSNAVVETAWEGRRIAVRPGPDGRNRLTP